MLVIGTPSEQIGWGPLPELPPIVRQPRIPMMQLTPGRIATAATVLRRNVTDEHGGWYMPVPGLRLTLARNDSQLTFAVTRDELPIAADDLLIWQDALGIPAGVEPQFTSRIEKNRFTGVKIQKFIVSYTWTEYPVAA